MTTTSQLVTRTLITVTVYRRRQQILCILQVFPFAELCPHFYGAPIDLRDIEVVASAIRCPWRLTPTIVRSLVVSRRLRGAP